MKIYISLIIVILISLNPAVQAVPKLNTYEIAEIDWCPQICSNSNEYRGYISEILDEVVKGVDGHFIHTEYPWSRAIKNVLQGVSIALSAPAKNEAPNLIYPAVPIGIQKMCFFVKKEASWQYTGVNSLKGVVVGIASDTSIEELNSYAKRYPESFQYQPYHERFIGQNVKKLNKNRIDTFIFTRNSTIYELNKLGIADKYKIAGCVSSAPVYIAFSPAKSMRNISIELSKSFDLRMLQLIHNKKVDEILSKYDVGFSAKELLKYKTNN
ncbi:MAG: ABC transporter substrate-binding protein [Gammaproteobacteria bacterium]|nr:ABC transporter substrate-binding protein [Gammaproteobacteria bacterium]